MQRIGLTVVLIIGVVGSVVIGYAAASVRGDAVTPFPTATAEVAPVAPAPTSTLQTTLPNCADALVRVGELCVRGTPWFPPCRSLGPTTKVSIACRKDPPR
jgi:hypothetical protein